MGQGTPAATWGEITLSFSSDADVRYVRARGVEASLSTVQFLLDQFGDVSDLLPDVDPKRFAKSGEGAPGQALAKAISEVLALRDGKAREQPGSKGDGLVPYRADLVLAADDGEIMRGLRARSLFLVDALLVDDFEPRLVQATLADVRYFWDDFGEITRSWNVPLPPAADGSPRWEAATSTERGTKPAALREILQALLDALPGELPIVRFPDAYASVFPAFQVRCWAASPKEVLSALLVHTGLELDVGPDLRARFFAPGEGEVGEADQLAPAEDNTEPHDPESSLGGAWSGQIPAGCHRYVRRRNVDAPNEVLVVGNRTEWTIAVDFLAPVIVREVVVDLDGSTERQVIEVSPENLAKLCRGQLDPGLDVSDPPVGVIANEPPKIDPRRLYAGKPTLSPLVSSAIEAVGRGPRDLPSNAPAPPALPGEAPPPAAFPEGATLGNLSIAGDGTLSSPAPVADPYDDPLFWERLVMQPKPWTALLPGVPSDTRLLLERQLFRAYQVPAPFRRCLPILARAERNRAGERRAPVLEGFRFTPYLVELPPRERVSLDRKKLLEERERLIGELAVVRDRFDKIRVRRASETAKAVASTVDAVMQGRDAEKEKSAEAVRLAVANQLTQSLEGLFGVDAAAADAKLTEQAIAAYEAQIRHVSELLDPTLPLQNEMAALQREIEAYRRDGVSVPTRFLAQEADLEGRLRDALAKRAASVKIDDERPELVTHYINLPLRTPFPFRVLDSREGIVQVDGEDLPGWLAEPDDALSFLALPVRLIFGTANERDPFPVTTGGQTDHSYYVSRALALVRADPALATILGDFGTIHPATRELTGLPIGNRLPAGAAGPGQVRFTFTREDQTTGQAEVGPFPWRVVEDVKLLVGLDGSSNREEVYQRCAAAARPLLRRPEVGESGELEVMLPRTVLCNGRISATEVRYRSDWGTFATVVSFASDLEPLLGVVGGVRDRGAFTGNFGLDPDATEGA